MVTMVIGYCHLLTLLSNRLGGCEKMFSYNENGTFLDTVL